MKFSKIIILGDFWKFLYRWWRGPYLFSGLTTSTMEEGKDHIMDFDGSTTDIAFDFKFDDLDSS